MHELPITAMPKDLPQHIVVNIESLVDFDSQIKASDIKLPEGVELDIEDPDAVVALMQEPKEEEETETEEFNPDAVQVEEKGKKEEKTDADNSENKE